MSERASIDEGSRRPRRPGWFLRSAYALQAVAGLIGAAGVMLAAAAAHKGGGDLTAIAATFAVLHAGALVALTGVALVDETSAGALLAGAAGMAAGTILFSGDLALIGLIGARPVPQAAPIGGTLLILSWIVVAGWGSVRAFRV